MAALLIGIMSAGAPYVSGCRLRAPGTLESSPSLGPRGRPALPACIWVLRSIDSPFTKADLELLWHRRHG
ncbi:MAG: hypothetical protein LC808_43675 [Actinobacteria bacterium]|nr:hypothetical protein [Actinomycetota bacterium]